MASDRTTEIVVIRHAPALTGGRLAGRRDVPADCTDSAAFRAQAAALGAFDRVLTSPALRCRQTAAHLWPDAAEFPTDPRLWEQDYGAWEGQPYADLPDWGAISAQELARHAPPGGESFAAQCARTHAALEDLCTDPRTRGARIALVAHAGTARAALSLALGRVEAGLAFRIDPLASTQILALPDGWAVGWVNRAPR
ncbi:histidine phosphatase family protein [Phaeovulum vinaykumarii]|uniref:Alpha-ribazole phosphatase n=1 Tax=Phaeovulum vinaykumarii TaxID=407234 RepID=A0A1N7KC81_9RHOB|nr:histidine phosphatase family protein [Phaeovulum vinaykumarii]SIS59149.1 alpha-ribazole phosphatase [Phaeovulum vinaykumarii]SOB94023.1 alpha-ribazole phosphatase [Phaeovulum vinaykumarii]